VGGKKEKKKREKGEVEGEPSAGVTKRKREEMGEKADHGRKKDFVREEKIFGPNIVTRQARREKEGEGVRGKNAKKEKKRQQKRDQ